MNLDLVTLTGKGVEIYFSDSVYIDEYQPKLIEIGDYVTVSREVVLVAHDSLMFNHDSISRWGRIRLCDFACVGLKSYIGPGTTIGVGAVLGACSCMPGGKEIPPMEIWAGNPARKVGSVYDYLWTNDVRAGRQVRPIYSLEEIQAGTATGQRWYQREWPRGRRGVMNAALAKIGMPTLTMEEE